MGLWMDKKLGYITLIKAVSDKLSDDAEDMGR